MFLTAQMGANGFGNEFIKLAKLLICRKVLGIPISKAYWRSPYRNALPQDLCYARRSERIVRLARDRLTYRQIEFGGSEHLSTGMIPVEDALACFLNRECLLPEDRCLVEFTGLDPGLESIENHGPFLFDVLLSVPGTKELLLNRMCRFDSRKLLVGVHIRRGDFRPEVPLGTPWPEGKWNIQIPMEWYDRICSLLSAAFPGRIQFFVTTNGTDSEVGDFCRKHEAFVLQASSGRMSPDVADMLALADCDVLISSASWFSGWAALLKPKPWLWYSCAHGLPPWGRESAFPYASEESLPDELFVRAEKMLKQKKPSEDRINAR
jgi:hypothetical protein